MKADIPACSAAAMSVSSHTPKFGLLKDSAATSEQHYITVGVVVFPSLRARSH